MPNPLPTDRPTYTPVPGRVEPSGASICDVLDEAGRPWDHPDYKPDCGWITNTLGPCSVCGRKSVSRLYIELPYGGKHCFPESGMCRPAREWIEREARVDEIRRRMLWDQCQWHRFSGGPSAARDEAAYWVNATSFLLAILDARTPPNGIVPPDTGQERQQTTAGMDDAAIAQSGDLAKSKSIAEGISDQSRCCDCGVNLAKAGGGIWLSNRTAQCWACRRVDRAEADRLPARPEEGGENA